MFILRATAIAMATVFAVFYCYYFLPYVYPHKEARNYLAYEMVRGKKLFVQHYYYYAADILSRAFHALTWPIKTSILIKILQNTIAVTAVGVQIPKNISDRNYILFNKFI